MTPTAPAREPRVYEAWLPPKTLAMRINELLIEHNLTALDLSRQAGIHNSVLSYARTGKRGLTLGKLYAIARAFDMTASELLAGVDLSEWKR